jgi:hypothetical protein
MPSMPKNLFSNRKLLYIIFPLTLISLIIDISISNITDLINPQATSHYGILTFVVLSTICLFGMYYMYNYLRRIFSHSEIIFKHSSYQKVLTIVFFSIILINCILVAEILIYQNYEINFLIILVTISYGTAFVLFLTLARRFLIWFTMKKSVVLILYAAAIIVMSFNMITSLIEFTTIIYYNESNGLHSTNSTFVTASTPVNFTQPFEENSPLGIVSNAQFYSVDVYFVISWLATGLFLYHYSRRIGRVKYWSLISIIIFYYLYYYNSLWQIPISSLDESSIPIILINTYSLTVGGIIFGIGFFLMARLVEVKSQLREYLIFCGIGLALFYNCANATVYQNPYPPFGILNVSFVSLASLYIFAGLSFAAISVSKDVELRRMIANYTKNNYNPVANIGSAEKGVKTRDAIVSTIERNKIILEESDGIDTSVTHEEVSEMVDNAIKELKRKKQV